MVDDELANLDLYRLQLNKVEHVRTAVFVQPLGALEYAAGHPVDLVLVDYIMPAVNGIQFIERFRTIVGMEDVPIVMITGTAELEVRRRALAAGANDFLSKPVDAIELSVRVRNLLALRERGRKLADRAAWLADEVRKATRRIAASERETIHRLTRAAEYRDQGTGMHIVRMGHYALALGAALGLNREEAELLGNAAPMHDVGKVGTPDAILLKASSLTDAEWVVMREHATIGYEILRDSESPLLRKAAEIAYTHHEKFDGSGYPRGLAGDAIPLAGRIVAITDVFDALLSDRPYKRAWPLDDTLAYIERNRGAHFDPRIADAFRETLPELLRIREEFADAGERMELEAYR